MADYRLLCQRDRVADKAHRCIWCGETIEAGQLYRREKSVYLGVMQNHAWHLECAKDRYVGLESGDDHEFIPYSADRPRIEDRPNG